jgi:hypothetical protein
MKIEFIKNTKEDSFLDNKHIVIDGKIDYQSLIINERLYTENKETIDKLGKLQIKDMRAFFSSIVHFDQNPENDLKIEFEVILKEEKEAELNPDNILSISFDKVDIYPSKARIIIVADVLKWNREYTIEDLIEAYKNVASNKNELIFCLPEKGKDYRGEICELLFEVKNEDILFDELVSNIYELSWIFDIGAQVVLAEKNSKDIFTTEFKFPDDYKAPCKQYLAYFSQFLVDIGINADTSISENASRVLFTVKPRDGNEALSRIKEALEIYINAPANLEVEISQNEKKDLAVIQWEANIHHLKSQVLFTQAAIQMKDATIEALQLSNYRLKEEVISAKQLAEKATGLNEEKVLGGTVAVKKYNGKGFSIDLPEIYRRLRRRLK